MDNIEEFDKKWRHSLQDDTMPKYEEIKDLLEKLPKTAKEYENLQEDLSEMIANKIPHIGHANTRYQLYDSAEIIYNWGNVSWPMAMWLAIDAYNFSRYNVYYFDDWINE